MDVGGLWHEKRRELAGRIRQERAERRAQTIVLVAERADRNRRRQEQSIVRPAHEMHQQPNSQQPGQNRPSFRQLCNERQSAPKILSPHRIMGGSRGEGRSDGHLPAVKNTQREMTWTAPSALLPRRVMEGFIGTVSNGKWVGDTQQNPDLSTAPIGFPIRPSGGRHPHEARPTRQSREWAEQVKNALGEADSRQILDALLMARVQGLLEADAPRKTKQMRHHA